MNQLSLRTILVVPFVLQLLGTVGLVAYLSSKNSQNAIDNLALQLQDEINARVENHLSTYLTGSRQINQINAEAVRLNLLDLQDFQKTAQYFWKQMRTYPVSYIAYGNADGEFIGIERLEENRLLTNEVSENLGLGRMFIHETNSQGEKTRLVDVKEWEPRSESWYRETVKAGKPIWSSIDRWNDQPNVLSISFNYPIYDATHTEITGVLRIDNTLEQIGEVLREIDVGELGRIFIVERNGLLVASSSAEQPYRLVNGRAKRLNVLESRDLRVRSTAEYLRDRFGTLNKIRRQQTLAYKLQGEKQFLHVMPYRDRFGLDWLIVVAIPQKEFTQKIDIFRSAATIVGVIALVLVTLMALLTARWIVRPIQELSLASDAIACGLLDQKIEVGGTRELRILAQSFNWMADQMRSSFIALDETNAALETRVEQRTEALQEEITERQLLEEKLRASEAEIRGFFEAMSEVVFLFDLQDESINIAPTNPARLYRSDADILNRTMELLFGERALEIRDRIQLALDSQQVTNFEYSFWVDGEENGDSDRELWFYASISPISETVIAWVARDVTARKEAERALERKAVRDRLLSRISRALMDRDLDTAIEFTLQEIGQLTGSDRAYITRCIAPGDCFGNTHQWHKVDVLSFIDELQDLSDRDRPWLVRQYQTGEPIRINSIEDLPPEATLEKTQMTRQGIQSMLHVPMRHAEQIVGFIALETTKSAVRWLEEDIQLLTFVGEMIAMAQARREAEEALRVEQEKSDRLLLNILPAPIAQQLKSNQNPIAENFETATILFADLVGFTPLSARLQPIELVGLLNEIFSTFDELTQSLGLEKIKTIGDAYMVAAGLPLPREDHAEAIANMALAMQTSLQFIQTTPNFRNSQIEEPLQMRIGINTGTVVAGVIGTNKFIYDLWGDAVNVASRMESSGQAGRIQVSQATYQCLKGRYNLEPRGEIEVKGKGQMMTYWLQSVIGH
ncbi:MAG: adenylate/guanylate cyclase domain-containing protein [Cyanobacteriota bacterium]|nr:adenylate/guanylate cyclase domain-containing protein [Cyanobacteriota bacterium]